MLSIILSHWSVYLYLFDLIAFTLLFFVDWARRSSQAQKYRPRRIALAIVPAVAAERTARFRRADNSVFPAEYRSGR